MKKIKHIKLLSSWFLFAGCLMLMALPDAWAGCIRGDEKCGPDGYVLVCKKDIYTDEMHWSNSIRECDDADDAGAACAEGDSKCGPDGYVLRCSRGIYDGRLAWESTVSKCDRQVCEPGIRRCRAGKVQECAYDGESWETRWDEECDSHDISED